MEEFKIYNPKGELLFSGFVDDDSYRLTEIMGDNRLELRFSLDHFVNIPEGSFCDYKTERYWLPTSQNYVKEHTEKFVYRLNLEGSICLFKSTKFKFFDFLVKDGVVKPTSSFTLKFPITATPRMVADLLVANLKLKHPQYPWVVGECIDSEPVMLDFNHDFCFDVLPKVADGFKTEWELNKYTLHFRKVEKMKDSAIDLSYGYNKGVKSGIERLQLDSKRIVNRVYVEGGERNIDRSTYGNATLLLPKGKTITYEGVEYTTDASGSYIERVVPLAGVEDSLDITKFYPKRVGTISAVEKIDDAKGFYNVFDKDIPAELDYSKHIIAGETMTIIFQTGQLAGKEFDVKYFHATKKFELVPINDNGLIYPQGNIIPAVGDKYAVFHMDMPALYITLAEEEALQEVVKYLWENEQSQYSYRWQLDGNYAARNWGEIRGFLNCGFFVKFSDPQFLPEPVDVRIVAVKELVNDDKRPEITIANNISSKSFGSILNQIPTQEQATERKDKEVVSYAKRHFKQSAELIAMLQDALDGFTEGINPITVQTMAMLVGDESLQFRFVSKPEAPIVVADPVYYESGSNTMYCDSCYLQHMTMGIDTISPTHALSEYKFWQMKAYQSPVLTEGDTPYYLYAKCSKSNQLGSFLISERAIKIEQVAGYYHFLLGVLSSEQEGSRSYVDMYGFTEILPGRITTDKIVSNDGSVFFDLVNNVLSMVKNGKGMIFNKGLELINAIFRIKNDKDEIVTEIDDKGNAMFGKGAHKFDSEGNASFGVGTHKFNADKSMSLAGGNMLYDLLNGLRMTGKFESNKDGNKIIIDPDTRSQKMLTKDGVEALSLSFSIYEDGAIISDLTCNYYLPDGSQRSRIIVDGTGISLYVYDTKTVYSMNISEGISISNPDKGDIFKAKWDETKNALSFGGVFPRTSSSVNVGEVYADSSGNLKIRLT